MDQDDGRNQQSAPEQADAHQGEKQQAHQKLLLTADLYIAALRKYFAGQYADHPETMIASASRMAGTLMLRSFSGDLAGRQAGQLLALPQTQERGAHLTTLLHTTVEQLGNTLDFAKAEAALEPHNISRLNLQQSQIAFEPVFTAMATANGLSLPQAACAACLASAILVHEAKKKIDINRAYITAVYGHIEALKTVPTPLPNMQLLDLSPFSTPAPKKKAWYQFWA